MSTSWIGAHIKLIEVKSLIVIEVGSLWFAMFFILSCDGVDEYQKNKYVASWNVKHTNIQYVNQSIVI